MCALLFFGLTHTFSPSQLDSHTLSLFLLLPLTFPSLALSFSRHVSLSLIISCSVPQSVLPPSRVESVNGSSVEVSWEEPAEVRGVIEKYVLKAYSRERPSSSSISATFPHSQHLTGKGRGAWSSARTPFKQVDGRTS